ncbi:EAL domain-containing protein [Duganella violaceipulchra]|uniref:Diguanylate cyclase (GGDEF)-like protein/PAS domain S-box-containing protein n=1 Tax=Duganella violaceipulchra TaxID=2849652 RepID=A0AA41L5L7_9BURK|nr:EAL domain-containing protein [Duganella violaceicalia]MBV6324324.1 EAL domain-containing protein [Duganella violaceicalia]MCP2007285.1 diguanylate cyclase (GGDEF)-like protein/PAS domain S-box-containing protein [Duganella violaceicalia]
MISTSVLIVEEQAAIAADLETTLKGRGYQICGIAASAEEALALARVHRPGLALMDIRLQGTIDGVQVADILRRELDVPVIFLSGSVDDLTLQGDQAGDPHVLLPKSDHGQELEFNFELAAKQDAEQSRLGAAGRKITLLVVEDEAVIAEDLKSSLIQRGYLVCGIAASGEEALELARQHHPDLALMDIRLQGPMDGIETAGLMRRELDIPVILVSAHSDNQTLQRATASTPYAFLLKPYEDRELQMNIEVAVHKHAGERQLALAHEEIRRTNATLEQRVTERTAALAAALTEIQQESAERMRMLADLQKSEMRFRQLAENIQQVFFLTDLSGAQIFYVSCAYEGIWGRSCASLYARPQSWMDAIHPDDLEAMQDNMPAQQASGRFDYVYRIVRPDAAIRWIRARGFPIADSTGAIVRIAGIADDITIHVEQERKIARLHRISVLLSSVNSAIVRIRDRDALFHEVCRIAVDEGGFSMAFVGVIDLVTQDGAVVAWCGGQPGYVAKIRLTSRAGLPESDRPACLAVRERRPIICNDIRIEPSLQPLKDELLRRGHLSVAAFPLILDQSAAAVLVLFGGEVNLFDNDEIKLLNEVAGDVAFGMDFIAKAEHLNYVAYFDLLTGLPNKMLFHERLTQCVNDAHSEASNAGVLVIDLVRFSNLNDVYGRHVGDAVLRELSMRLKAVLEEPNRLARVGGDMFALFMPQVREAVDLVEIYEQLVVALEPAFGILNKSIHLSIRAGIAIYPQDGGDAESLLKHAEAALKKAKSGNERYLYYSAEMNASIAVRLQLEHDLRTAVSARQFLLYYQPRVDLISGRIVSAEALIRWQHPGRGMVPPVQFIPLAEESGLILPIGAWVIDAVCAQQADWRRRQIKIVPVAINLSAMQVKKHQVLTTIVDALRNNGLEREYVEFELTESVLMDNPEEAAINLRAFKKIGGALALDDFGTGYSSLAYLKRFEFDIVKIDRAFVTEITRSREDAAIATAVIAMAHSLNMRVVAEGVETEAQLRYLRKLRCDEIQGYFFSPPVPALAFEEMLRTDRRLPLAREASGGADTVLLVDDEANILSALKRLLRQDSYHILTATNAEDALELLALNYVQVVVTDQRMPGTSGTEFLSIVKNLYPDTVRLILTGYTDLVTVTESVNRGEIFKFIAKPWQDKELRELIRDAFRHYRPRSPPVELQ